MTNKVICVEKVLEWIQNNWRLDTGEGPLERSVDALSLIGVIESGNLSPSPAPAEGVMSTVTNCPTCGSAVKVGGDGETHYYIPITAQSAQWLPMETVPMDGSPVLVLLEKELLRSRVQAATFHPNIQIIGGLFSFDAPKPIGWMPTPTTNTREGM